MTLPTKVLQWLVEEGMGEIHQVRSVGGGCINNGARLETTEGKTFFLKTNRAAPKDMFAREAEGLKALSVMDGPRVPEVFLIGDDFLLLEDLNPSHRQPDYWETFGQALAHLHQHTSLQFGFDHDNYIGSTPQPNTWTEDGYDFFAQHRLRFQARLAQEAGYLNASDRQQVESLCQRLPELIPAQPASLSHGDLWSGNAMTDEHGQPAIIDPATHYGWAEAELGMTTLFGGFTNTFYEAYNEVNPLEPGWRDRLPLYNLYHILNHVNLFGSGYLAQARRVLSRFA